MAELSVAIVGCGAMGSVHRRCWESLSGVRVVAVCDSDGAQVAKAVSPEEEIAAFLDLGQMLQAGQYDIVDICAPFDAQASLVEKALRAGSHVLCETPFTADPEAARSLVRLAEDRERLLMPGFCHRFHPPLLFAKELLDNDDLGRPILFRCQLNGFWEDSHDAAYGDVLWNTALHGVDLFRAFCGETVVISGRLKTAKPGLSVKDTALLTLESESGALGTVEACWSAPGGARVVEFYGTAGAFHYDYDTNRMRYLTAEHPVWQQREEGGAHRFERQLAHFADAVRGLQPLEITGEDGVRAVELCAEVQNQGR